MSGSSDKLDALADLLSRTGGDAKRIEVVRRAQRFRRSWLELGEALNELRRSKRYEGWGFSDFYEYCTRELTLRRSTVDKLTISYSTLRKHAPEILQRDGVAQAIPSCEAVDYFGKALGDYGDDVPELVAKPRLVAPRSNLAHDVTELKQAIFDEGASVTELHRRFDETFFPKPKTDRELDLLRRTNSTAKRLLELVQELDDLPDLQRAAIDKQVGKLIEHLEERMEPLRAKIERRSKKLNRAEG